MTPLSEISAASSSSEISLSKLCLATMNELDFYTLISSAPVLLLLLVELPSVSSNKSFLSRNMVAAVPLLDFAVSLYLDS